MKYRKKLIEVALPLEAINVASAKEKSIRHGHPSTLHLWWARRPLAACRAVLFASLVDDPSSDPMFAGDEDIEASKRAELFNLIEELVQWDNSNNPRIINKARAEIARCIASRKIETGEFKKLQTVATGATAHDMKQMLASSEAVNEFLATHAPPALDPFCGGGSIPLEAQRLGLRAFASDLNPVPVLINKALIEIPAKFAGHGPINSESRRKLTTATYRGAQGLAEDVRYYGKWMRQQAESLIGHLYPKFAITPSRANGRPELTPLIGQELTVVAWLWSRTIQCPNPACRARAPLVRSFWLCRKKGKEVFIHPVVDEAKKKVRFQIRRNGQPQKETSNRTGAVCLFCNTIIKKPQLREVACQNGVQNIPLAVVCEGPKDRLYLPFDVGNVPQVERPSVPFVEYPMTNDKRWFSPPLYGLPNFADLFTNRQLVALTTFSDLVGKAREQVMSDVSAAGKDWGDAELASDYADAIATYLAFAVDKMTDTNSTLCTWQVDPPRLRATFGRQALPMTWDFAEANIFADAAGDFQRAFGSLCEVLDELVPGAVGAVRQLDATAALAFTSNPILSTDPPYYDNIGYADLSDYFYVWLRRCLSKVYPDLFSTLLTPKTQELIAASNRHNGSKHEAQAFFEAGLGKAFSRMRTTQNGDYPLTVYYAFKQSEADDSADGDYDVAAATVSTGWETMLEALVSAGFVITGTWPARSEMMTRNVGRGTNALATSIVLVCRPRTSEAPLTSRKEFVSALRREMPDALRHLQRGSIAPVDLAQAAIGPGMAVYSRHSKVMETDGSAMPVRTALGLINQALDEVLAEQEGEFDADTRWALAWFEQFGIEEGPFGIAETLSKAKNTAINGLIEAGVVKARAGKVQLLKRDELPDDWNPATDKRLTVWEVTQHLIRTVETKGESAAAALLHQLGGMGEIARDLAYRLYTICERKKWAEEALAYNGLVIAWSELSKLALSERAKPGATQTKMFD